jgi:protein TonB
MFLEKSTARLFSVAAHTIGLAALISAAAPDPPLPSIDPPCTEVLTWMPVRLPPFAPPPPDAARQPPPPESATGLAPGDGPAEVEEPIAVGTRGGQVGGVCGCGYGGVVGELRAGLPTIPIEPPPAPAALPSSPLRAGDDVPVPARVVDVQPRYPPLARHLRLDGVVILDATIDELGRVVDVRVLRSITAFDRAAIEAVRQWRYAPAMRNGLPVRVLLMVTVSFTHPV